LDYGGQFHAIKRFNICRDDYGFYSSRYSSHGKKQTQTKATCPRIEVRLAPVAFGLFVFLPIFSEIFRRFFGGVMPLTRKQKAAVDALATTTTQTKAAEIAGCAARSIRGWLKEPEFKNALLERERELRNETARIAAIYAVDALNVLHGIIENERNDANLRRLAARDLLNYLHQTETNFDLDIRITRLEVDYENNSKTG